MSRSASVDDERRAARERVGDDRRLVGRGRPGIGRKGVEAEARGGLHRAVAGVVFEEQRPAAAGHVERMLVQRRQQVDEPWRVREERNQRRGRRAAPLASGTRGGGRTGQSPRSGVSRHLFLCDGPAGQRAELYVDVSPVKSC